MPEESGEVTAEQLLAAASEYDNAVAAGEAPEVEIQPEEPKEEVQDESPPEPAEEAVQEPETEEQNADEQVSSLTEGETPEVQEQPKKSKWEKNEERKTSSWKQINAEKEEIKAGLTKISTGLLLRIMSEQQKEPSLMVIMTKLIPLDVWQRELRLKAKRIEQRLKKQKQQNNIGMRLKARDKSSCRNIPNSASLTQS